jgi:hypothetical protein
MGYDVVVEHNFNDPEDCCVDHSKLSERFHDDPEFA